MLAPKAEDPNGSVLHTWVWTFALAACVVSSCGSLWIIFSFMAFKKLRRMPFDMVFYVAVSDFMMSMSIFIRASDLDSNLACTLSGSGLNYFNLTSAFWTVAICLTIMRLVVLERPASWMRYFHVVCWGAPAIFTIPALVPTQQFLPTTTGWCFVPEDKPLLRLVVFYLPSTCTFVANVILLCIVWWHTRRLSERARDSLGQHRNSRIASQTLNLNAAGTEDDNTTLSSLTGVPHISATTQASDSSPLYDYHQVRESGGLARLDAITEQKYRRILLRMLLYVYVYIFVQLCGDIDRLNQYVTNTVKVDAFTKAHTMLLCLRGLLNAIVYGTSQQLLAHYKSCLLPHQSWSA